MVPRQPSAAAVALALAGWLFGQPAASEQGTDAVLRHTQPHPPQAGVLAAEMPSKDNGPDARLSAGRRWTAADIVSAPKIDALSLSADGQTVVYVEHHGNVALNRQESVVGLVRVKTGELRRVLVGRWAQDARAIPNEGGWSILADVGDGVQLYRFGDDGKLTPVVSVETVVQGKVGGAVSTATLEYAPRDVGVLAYGWAPDGRTLWYMRAKITSASPKPLVDDAAWQKMAERRWTAASDIELRVRLPNGDDVLVDSRPYSDRWVRSSANSVNWTRDSRFLHFGADEPAAASLREPRTLVWSLEARQTKPDLSLQKGPALSKAPGPFGGLLETRPRGRGRELIERFPDGTVRNHGAVDFRIETIGSSPSRSSPDGSRTAFGIKFDGVDERYGLVVVDRRLGVRQIKAQRSLSTCAFDVQVQRAVCVEDSMTAPPTLVQVDLMAGRTRHLVNLAIDHEQIAPLRVEHRTWTNRLGFAATGSIVYPRDYAPGRKYPAIIVTHWGDADDRFVSQAFQWDYPVQVFAERGYVVLGLNSSTIGQTEAQTAEVREAWLEWAHQSSGLSPTRMQDLLWLNEVATFEAVISDLAAKGLVDATRVGIAGYSAGSQLANVAMTQSKLFAAASSGDGGFAEPTGYYSTPSNPQDYDVIYGGSPFDPDALENYRRMSPTFRASQASGAILQQTVLARVPQIELYHALKKAGVPTQITLYPGENAASLETHLFHIPANRLAAMQENLDWFDFWLLGKENSNPLKAEQYKRWRTMRARAQIPNKPDRPDAEQ